MKYQRVSAILFVVVSLICSNGCGDSASTKSAASPTPQAAAPEVQPEATPVASDVPYAEDLEAFRQKVPTATPLLDTYPTDANQLVTYSSPDGTFVVSSLGAAIWKGDRAQIETYLNSGADLASPIWYAGDEAIERSSPANMAINAVYMKHAEPDFLKYILEHGADANAMETMYGQTPDDLAYSSGSVLNHSVTSGIPELTKIVLDAGIHDATVGSVSDTGAKASPLIAAVLRGNVETVRLLLDAGIDPDVGAQSVDGENKRPIDLARGYLARNPAPDLAKRLGEIVALLEANAPSSP